MSRVATVNFFEQVHNDTFTVKEFRFFAADGTTPLDLSDVVPRVQIRKDTYNGRLVQTATVGDGISWVNQASGTFQLGGFLANWGAGDYYYDLQFTYTTSGIVRTYLRGKIVVIEDATH
jgi:hypothetical protein